MTLHHQRTLATVSLCTLASLIPTCAAQSLDQLRNSVVELTVGKGPNISPEIGTGFIVSVDGGKLSILTARHLFYQNKDKFVDDISATFYVDKLHPRKALWQTDSPALDLAVVEVAGMPSSVSQQVPSITVRPDTEHPGIGETLYVFGGKSQAWQVPTVSISDTEDGDRPNGIRFTGIGIRAGFSGSAIADANGRLVAVHLGAVESDASFGHAQLMASAYGALIRLGAALNKLEIGPGTTPNTPTPRQTTACLKPPVGLVSWWTGDSDESDALGTNNPAGFSAVTHEPGKVKNGFRFGAKGFIQIPAAASLANQQFTWAAWARPDGSGPNNDAYGSCIVGQNVDNTHDSVYLCWSYKDGRFSFVFGGIPKEVIFSRDSFAPSQFHFVAATYDLLTFRLYVDGTLQGSLSEGKTIGYSSSPWMIGGGEHRLAQLGFPRTWNGIIDEVQAFNRALSDSELESIFRAGSAGECKPAKRF